MGQRINSVSSHPSLTEGYAMLPSSRVKLNVQNKDFHFQRIDINDQPSRNIQLKSKAKCTKKATFSSMLISAFLLSSNDEPRPDFEIRGIQKV